MRPESHRPDEELSGPDATDRKRERLEVARALRSLVGTMAEMDALEDDELETFQRIPRRR